MTNKAQEVLQLALQLEPGELVELVEHLNASVQADDELAKVVKRRMDEVEAGTAELIPWSEVRARLEAAADS